MRNTSSERYVNKLVVPAASNTCNTIPPLSDLTNATVRSTNNLFFRSTLLIVNRFPWQQTDRSSLADPGSAVEAIASKVVGFCFCFDVNRVYQ